MKNRAKTNSQLFPEYFDIVAASKSRKWDYETRRVLTKFWHFIGDFPPTMALFAEHFKQYSALSQATRVRYYFIFKGFFDWYSGEKMPFKIKAPKPVPQKVADVDLDKLIEAVKSKRTHKKTIERDLVLIETAANTGLRADELAALEVQDMQLSAHDARLLVREGKGHKSRSIPLNDHIRGRLAVYTKNMRPSDRLFGIATKTISLKIGIWARKAGVPIHTHSLRHKFATDILDAGGNIRSLQQLMGHASLGTTESYLAVTDKGLRDAVQLLDKTRAVPDSSPGNRPAATQSPDTENMGLAGGHFHEQKLRELAESLAGTITIPSCMDKDLWRDLPVEFKPGTYNLPLGTVEIDEAGNVRVEYPDVQNGLASPILKESLFSHLASSGINEFAHLAGPSGVLGNLVTRSGRYSEETLRLLRMIALQVEKTGAKVWFKGEQEPGLTREFIVTAWVDSLQRAEGHQWITGSWYKQFQSDDDTGLLSQSCGGFVIGRGESEQALVSFVRLHMELRERYAKSKPASDLAVINKDLHDLAHAAKQHLAEFTNYRELPGKCRFC